MNRAVTEVAAAVIVRPGEFLLAQRPEGKPYPGYWEFPGGKIEPGEDAREALTRELREELGIEVREATPWITRRYTYTHASVRLHFFRVSAWDGEPQPLEDQAIRWQAVGRPDVSPMLPANAPVLAALALPEIMIVSAAADMGIDAWVHAIARSASFWIHASMPTCAAFDTTITAGRASAASTGAFAGSIGETSGAPTRCQRIAWSSSGCGSPSQVVTRKKCRRTVAWV